MGYVSFFLQGLASKMGISLLEFGFGDFFGGNGLRSLMRRLCRSSSANRKQPRFKGLFLIYFLVDDWLSKLTNREIVPIIVEE